MLSILLSRRLEADERITRQKCKRYDHFVHNLYGPYHEQVGQEVADLSHGYALLDILQCYIRICGDEV
jgi:N-formylglutamate amidohydrolase